MTKLKKTKKSLPYGDWPEADRTAWDAAFSTGTLLGDQGIATHWSARSRTTILWSYGRWLTFLDHSEQLNDNLVDRVSKERVYDYINEIKTTLKPWTVWCYLSKLYDALRVMSPETDWSWLRAIHNQLARHIPPDNQKLSRVKDSSVLYQLGLDLMLSAQSQAKPCLQSAIDYRDGLMIALLAARPIRRSNLAAIRINKHIIPMGDQWCLSFTKDEMKNRRPYHCLIPHALAPYIECYLNNYRCLFPRADEHDGLWASAKGCPLEHDGVYNRIIKRTRDAFGEAINPHLFRDCAATTLAIYEPEHVRAASSLLGHGDLRTTEKHYNQANSLQASRNYQSHLLARRKE